MNTTPVLLLVLFSLLLFFFDLARTNEKSSRADTLFLSVLFLLSGMPALIYQIVWQRVLFSIYGVNSQSVAVVVSAFLIGLGLGSLLGGYISARLPRHAIKLFGIAELGVAIFGLSSLKIFHWFATFTSGASLGPVILASRSHFWQRGHFHFPAVLCEHAWFRNRLLPMRNVFAPRIFAIRRGHGGCALEPRRRRNRIHLRKPQTAATQPAKSRAGRRRQRTTSHAAVHRDAPCPCCRLHCARL